MESKLFMGMLLRALGVFMVFLSATLLSFILERSIQGKTISGKLIVYPEIDAKEIENDIFI